MAITLALLAYLHLPVVRRFILTVKDCEPFEDGFENGKRYWDAAQGQRSTGSLQGRGRIHVSLEQYT